MAELRSLLAFMDAEDRERALRRYEQLFDRAGEAGEEMLLEELGSPIRQVLEVDREYRKAKKAGKLIYAEELPDEISGTEEIIPSRREETSADLGQIVREAAAELEKDTAPKAEDKGSEGSEEDLFPIADLEYTEKAGTGDGAPSPEKGPEPAEISARPARAPTPAPESVSYAAAPISEEDDGEIESIMRFASDYSAKKEETVEEKGYAQREEKPGALRVFAAILVTVPLIVLWIAGFALSLALGMTMLAVGFAFCAAGVYFAGYAANGYVAYMPDLLLVCGGALACFALALFFLWFGLWFIVGGIAALARTTGRIYRGILNKRRRGDEYDE